MIDISAIFKKLKIDVQLEEENVYKVLSTDNFDVDLLMINLKSCLLLTSPSDEYILQENGINHIKAKIYYIILGYNNDNLLWKYKKEAIKEYGKAVVRSYDEVPDYKPDILTLYARGEI